jgi:hypothetical protein
MSEQESNDPAGLPEGVHLELAEAPLGAGAPDGSIGIRVNVSQIMDQVHQHWARQMADQIQRNAELAAALTVTSEELEEVRAKLTALTEVTNAPAEDIPERVRQINGTVEQQVRDI